MQNASGPFSSACTVDAQAHGCFEPQLHRSAGLGVTPGAASKLRRRAAGQLHVGRNGKQLAISLARPH